MVKNNQPDTLPGNLTARRWLEDTPFSFSGRGLFSWKTKISPENQWLEDVFLIESSSLF